MSWVIVLLPENPAVLGRDEGLPVGALCFWMQGFTLASVAPPVDETKQPGLQERSPRRGRRFSSKEGGQGSPASDLACWLKLC